MDLQCLTSSISNVWLSTDHNGIVWCKQLVMVIKRAMFDLIDHQRRQLNTDPIKRAYILNYHFMRKQLKLSFDALTRLNSTSLINSKGKWNEQRKSSWTYVQSKVIALQYFAIPIRRDGNLVVIARNVDFHDWILICKAKTEINNNNSCEKATVISRVRLLPSPNALTKSIHLRLIDWKSQTHVVVQVQPTTERVEIFSEVYGPDDRHLDFNVPYMPYNLLFTMLKVEKTARNAVFYNITLVGFNTLWQAYSVKVTPLCKRCKNNFTSVMRFYVPWNNEDVYTLINCTDGGQTVVKLQSAKPDVPYSDPQIHFYLDPQCQFRITVSGAFSDILGQIVRHYSSQIFVLAVAVLIEVLSAQLSTYLDDGKCPSLFDSLAAYRICLNLIIPSYVILYLYKIHEEIYLMDFISNISQLGFASENIKFSGTLLLLYFCALVLVHFLTRLILIPVSIIAYFSSHIFYNYFKMEPGKLKIRQNFPVAFVVASAILISIAKASCGSLLLLLLFTAYIFKVGQLRGQLNTASNRGRKIGYLSLAAHIHFTLLVLWFLTWLTTIPCLMVWVKNLKFELQLEFDHSFVPASVLIASLAFCWVEEASKTPKWMVVGAVWLLRILSICVVFS
uniref:GPI inositol-deacylase n=1 Tax=Strigamia maritima TaxID=126957 RepID=T1IRN3_STRMM